MKPDSARPVRPSLLRLSWRAAALALVAAGLVVVGCSSRFQSMVTKRAVADFSCSEDQIELKRTRTAIAEGLFEATGCGRADTYYTKCNLIGICKALSSAELARYNARVDAQYAAYAASANRSSSSSSSSPPPSSSSSSSPSSSSMSSSLPSNCGFNSDCGPGVKCNSGRCANTEGGSCGFDSDCGGNGAKCNSGKCSNAPDGRCAFDSECPGGKCSSGKCRF
ncbi:MAG: hypothetical protein R3A79_15345 [Nannocystaceae bacterium]